MDNYTPGYILDKYNEKINSVGYKLKQAIGHPEEQMRLLMQLKIYINSMINDLTKMDDELFSDQSRAFQDINELYNLTYGILTSITSVISGMTIDVTGSDTDAVLTKDSQKDAIVQKYKLMLGGVDKIMRYLITLNKPVHESYIRKGDNMNSFDDSSTFFDEINIAEEASTSYKIMRKLQTNKLALAKQLSDQKKLCQKKYAECRGQTDLEESFRNWLNKQKAAIQRKINGKEIKNKNDLQKFITLYDSYLSKLGSSASESFIYNDLLVKETTIYDDFGICTEGSLGRHANFEHEKLKLLDERIRVESKHVKERYSNCKTNTDKVELRKTLKNTKSRYEKELDELDTKFPDDEYSPAFKSQYKIKLEKLIRILDSV